MEIASYCDFRAMFGPARDQKSRPTCVAFAVSDVHAGLRDGWEPLSCEYLYFHTTQRTGDDPTQGVTLDTTLESLRKDGQPLEEAWPYLSELPDNLSNWFPPNLSYELFRRDSIVHSGDIGDIVIQLEAGRPLVICMTLSPAFYNVESGPSAVIDAVEPLISAVRHAVIAVGYGIVQTGQRFILIRNSWGESWGDNGYAWVSERYLLPRLITFGELTEDISDGFAH